MSILLLLLVLVTLIVVGVLVVHLNERVKALEGSGTVRRVGEDGGANDMPDPAFAAWSGEALWMALSQGQGPDPEDLEALRRAYEPALTRHIEEVLLEAGLDARQGIRVPPELPRNVRTGNGMVASWFPPDEALLLYGLAQEQAKATGERWSDLSRQIAEASNRLREAIGLPPTSVPTPKSATSATDAPPSRTEPAPLAVNKN